MTLSSQPIRYRYHGNGITDVFAFPSRVFVATDLVVQTVDASTNEVIETLQSPTDYSVSIDSSTGTASVTTAMAKIPAIGVDILIFRAVPLVQPLSLPTGTPFPARDVETELDRAIAILQEHDDRLSRAAVMPETADPSLRIVLPSPMDGYAIVWDGVGGAFRNTLAPLSDLEGDAEIVADNITHVIVVSTNIGSVINVSNNIGDVNTVAGAISQVVATGNSIANVNIVASDLSGADNIGTVADDLNGDNDIGAVAGQITHVVNVSSNMAAILSVEDDLTEINGLYAIRSEIEGVYAIRSAVVAVDANATNINAVNANKANIDAVAGDLATINAVNANKANIDTVAGSASNVNIVATNISAVNTAASNMTAIIAAPTAASNAAASAIEAANQAAALVGTSTSSVAVGTGSKTFTTQAGKQWFPGLRLTVTNAALTRRMTGEVTAYSGTTLTLDVDYTEGSGSGNDWRIQISGDRGEKGDSGDIDATGATSGQAPIADGAGDWAWGNVQAPITGGASTITTSNLTANRALLSDGSGKVAVSTVTHTELSYVSGVTSGIQTQINGKQATITLAAKELFGRAATGGQGPLNEVEVRTMYSNVSALGTVTGGTTTFNLNTARSFTLTQDGNVTFVFSNPLASGAEDIFTVRLVWITGTRTWPASVDWMGDEAPDFEAGKTYELVFKTVNGGTTWSGFYAQVGG